MRRKDRASQNFIAKVISDEQVEEEKNVPRYLGFFLSLGKVHAIAHIDSKLEQAR